MMKRLLAAALAASAILFSGCNNFLSEPPGSVAVTLSSAPTATAGITDCAISWATNVATKHVLEYGTATGAYTVATPLTSSDSKDHSVSLESLLPSTTYYYRVRSYYQNTQETDSDEYSFTTGALTSVTIVSGPNLTVGQTSCDLSWTTNVATKHSIEYGTTSRAYSAATVQSAVAATANSDSITGLSPATTYYYRIRSTYQNGLEGLSAEATFTTLARTALAITAGPTAIPSQTGCALAWTTNLSTTHIVEYGTVSGAYTAATVQTQTAALANAETLSGLSPATTYYYRVRSFATDGQTATSAESSFATLAGAATLAFSSGPAATPSQTSASIAYSTNYATTSTIEYGTVPGTYTSSLTLDGSSNTHTRTLSGLAEVTTYYYVVHCYLATGGSVSSEEKSFTTTVPGSSTLTQLLRGIWIVGGCYGNTYSTLVSQIDLFDPVTSTWYPSITSLPTPVSFAAVGTGTYGGHHVLVIAGGFDSLGNVVSKVQRYDIESATWLAEGSPLTQARANVNGVVKNNRLYVIGGTTGSATAAWAAANTQYEYDIGTDSWSVPMTAAAASVSERTPVVYNDTILYFGGRANAYTATTSHDGLIIGSNAITTGITEVVLTAARTGHSAVLYNPSSGYPTIITLGGFASFTSNTVSPRNFILNGGVSGALLATDTVQYLRYPFAAGSGWGNYTSLPAVALGAAAIYGDTLYYFGGTATYLTPTGRTEAYSSDISAIGTTSKPWNNLSAMPVGRYGHAAVRCN